MKIKYQNRTEYRNKQGELHRTNGPAKIWQDGTQFYYQNGIYHREDGPAVIWPDGLQEYWQNGKRLTKDEYENQLSR